MRTSIVAEKMLEILLAGVETTVELFDIFTSGYNVSYAKLRRARHSPPQFRNTPPKRRSDTTQFYSTLNHLKNQGLVKKTKPSGKGTHWGITMSGIEKLKQLKKRKMFASSAISYQSTLDATLKIIVYDIPIREGRKRYWLRTALQCCGFQMLQRSVWMGKRKLPETFLKDLRERGMLSYVHIFSIRKEGTLRKFT